MPAALVELNITKADGSVLVAARRRGIVLSDATHLYAGKVSGADAKESDVYTISLYSPPAIGVGRSGKMLGGSERRWLLEQLPSWIAVLDDQGRVFDLNECPQDARRN